MGGVRTSLFIASLFVITTIFNTTMVSALDGDNDGIDDTVDDCPFAWGNSTIGYTGCPDIDGNGGPDFANALLSDWDDSMRALYASDGSSRAVSWAPDSIHLAVGGGSDVNLYTANGLTLSTLYSFPDEYVRSLAFSPDGSLLAAGAYFYDNRGISQIVVLQMNWVNKSASVIANLSSSHTDDVPSVTWSSNGSYLFTGGGEGELRQFSANNWTMVRNYSFDPGDTIWSVDASPDDRLIAGLASGGELKVFWTNNGTKYMDYDNHTGDYALGTTFSPDGRWLLTGGFDNRVNIYNVTNASHVAGFTDSSRDVYSISFSPNGAFFVVAGDDDEARIYLSPDNVGNMSNYSYVAKVGRFGSSSNSRGVRAVEWSPDSTKIGFAQKRGRATVYILPEGFLQLRGDVTAQLMENSWRSNWIGDGRPLAQYNSSLNQMTQDLCNGNTGNRIGVNFSTAQQLTSPLANYSTSGLLNCTSTSRQLLEVPIGRMPASFFVQAGGAAEACLKKMGGLSMGQLRWLFSGASVSTLTLPGWAPAMDLTSIAPNDDGNGVKEWVDLDSSCPNEGLHVFGRWDNRSIPTMAEQLFTCAGCQFDENFYSSTGARYRFQEETRSDIIHAVEQNDEALGFTELRVVDNNSNIWLVPIADNWTHSAKDHVAAGGVAVLPSYNNSSEGIYPAQSDYKFIINYAELDDKFALLDWLLTDDGQDQWDAMGFVRLNTLARVQSWERIGVDATYLLPDLDDDGVWDGNDLCPNTWQGESVDGNGCASHQLDDDGDGYYNNEDDCVNQSGTSLWPQVGCIDTDGDGWMDTFDAFPSEPSQWADGDGDGFGDNSTGINADDCPSIEGNSTNDRLGCIDADGDGWSNSDSAWSISEGADEFPLDPMQWIDTDDDGYGDNYSYTLDANNLRVNQIGDAFILDSTQWSDNDGDGFGDNPEGIDSDDCPNQPGTSSLDSLGCPDADFDGWSDSVDLFPNEITQWADFDGDGFGDNWEGASPDQCVETPFSEINEVDDYGCGPSERDSDSDGIMDNADSCPNTPMSQAIWVRANGCSEEESDDDSDGVFNPDDGPNGVFKNDATQSADSDGDGFGDNPNGTNGDNCPTTYGNSTSDRKGCLDSDGDGYSDPGFGWGVTQGADAWKVEPSQWSDYDKDGYYDNYDNPVWTASREDGWPGKYVAGARMADKCPMVASDNSYPDPGCPEQESTFVLNNTGGSSAGIPTSLIAIVALMMVGLGGLVVAVMMKQRKPKRRKGAKKRRPSSRLEQALDVVDEAAEEWLDEQVVEDSPSWDLEGVSGDDGVEWLEWPEGSDSWWQRDDSGYWVKWQQ